MKFLLLTLAVLCFTCAHAQQRIGNFMAWGRDNGLPPSLYYSVYQSSDGYLWIGSSSGIVRFDGKRFKTIISEYQNPDSPSDNVISDFVEDNNGNLWICGSIQGVTKYNLKSSKFRRYARLSADRTPMYGIYRVLKDADGTLWFGTTGRGLAKYLPEKDTFRIFITDPSKPHDGSTRNANSITGIAADKKDQNILWLSTFEGLYSFNKTTGTFIKYPRFASPSPDGVELFMCISVDDQNRIWLGTWYNSLVSYDPGSNQFHQYAYPKAGRGGFEYAVSDLVHVSDSLIYLASFNHGLLCFNKRTKNIRPLLTTDQLPQGSSGIDIQRVSLTPSAGVFAGGNYYIYQQHKAFNRLGNFIAFDTAFKEPGAQEIGLTEVVYDPARKGYWMSCFDSRNIYFLDEYLQRQEKFLSTVAVPAGFRDIAVDGKQRVWAVGLSGGLMKLDEGLKRFTPVTGLSLRNSIAKRIRKIDADNKGNLWMVSKEEVVCLDIGTSEIEVFPFKAIGFGLIPLFVNLTAGNGLVWVYSDAGLFYCKLSEKKLRWIDPVKSGLANVSIKSLTLDAMGNPWIGFHYNGLQVLDAKSLKVVTTHDLNDGMPGMQVNSLSCDASGKIWAGFAAGLAVFDPKVKVWQLFNRNDGIRRDYADGRIVATTDGRVFLSQPNGFIFFSNDMFKAGSAPPVIHVTSVKVDGKTFLSPDDASGTIRLPHHTTEISIEYAAMDWLYPLRTKYFYRVQNLHPEDGWIANNDATINLAGLAPGKYVVHMYAVNGDGIQSKEILLPIIIQPPFWFRWWFIALSVIAFLAILYAIYRYRIRQLKQVQQMRNTISRNLHDDIGASLSNIHILNELAKRNVEHKEKATAYLVKAGEDIQYISESLSDIVWNINPRYDDLENLFIRMKRYAADMLEGKNIESDLNFPDATQHKLFMPMDQRRDFYLIFKEAVNNLAKYSNASKAIISVQVLDHSIDMLIQDNGRGFDWNRANTGNGIQNMKQRAEKWNARISIDTKKETGTSVRLKMKLHHK